MRGLGRRGFYVCYYGLVGRGLVERGLGKFIEFDEGDGDFATHWVVLADDACGFDQWMAVKDFFDLAWEDVFTADDEHFFDAAGNVEVAFVVDAADVAGAEEAVGGEDFGGFLGETVVAGHDVWATHLDFAIGVDGQWGVGGGVGDALFDAWECAADGVLAELVRPAPVADRAGFGEAIAFVDENVKAFAKLRKDGVGEGLAAGNGVAERLEIVGGCVFG